jgi:hypothetical protein
VIPVIVLRIGPALVATMGFAPGRPVPAHDIFRVDQAPGQPAIFKVN